MKDFFNSFTVSPFYILIIFQAVNHALYHMHQVIFRNRKSEFLTSPIILLTGNNIYELASLNL